MMMTRLFAEIVDFQLVQDDAKNDVCYRFRFGSCESFDEMIEGFKDGIPLRDRKPYPEKAWLWEVTASAYNYRILDRLFDNFAQCHTMAKSQMRMF